MQDTLKHKWQAAIKLTSEMLCETKRVVESCPIGTENDNHPSVRSQVMREMFISVWITVGDFNALAKRFIKNPGMSSTRNLYVIQRDLIDKIIDIPFIHLTGKGDQYSDFKGDVSLTKLFHDIVLNNSEYSSDEKEIVKEYMNQNLISFSQKYDPEEKTKNAKKLYDRMRNWDRSSRQEKLRQGLLKYIEKDFYKINSVHYDTTGTSLKEDCEKLPLRYDCHSCYVHDLIPNTVHKQQRWTEHPTEELEDNHELSGFCIFALYVAAAHYYDYAKIPKTEMEKLRHKILDLSKLSEKNPISSSNRNVKQVDSTVDVAALAAKLVGARCEVADSDIVDINRDMMIKLLAEDGICEVPGLGIFVYTDNKFEFTASETLDKQIIFQGMRHLTEIKQQGDDPD